MIIFLLLALIVVISAASVVGSLDTAKEYPVFTVFFGLITLISFIVLILYASTPRAIHVYQGGTTLEITYKDGVPVDSVVVFK